MTHQRYKELRLQLGTQEAVAHALKNSRSMIAKRESGAIPITQAAELAITMLSLLQVRGPGENRPLDPRAEKIPAAAVPAPRPAANSHHQTKPLKTAQK